MSEVTIIQVERKRYKISSPDALTSKDMLRIRQVLSPDRLKLKPWDWRKTKIYYTDRSSGKILNIYDIILFAEENHFSFCLPRHLYLETEQIEFAIPCYVYHKEQFCRFKLCGECGDCDLLLGYFLPAGREVNIIYPSSEDIRKAASGERVVMDMGV
jgi:hypothetical protein